VRFSLDTNILVYACLNDAGWRHDQAIDLVVRASTADYVITLQVLGEFYHVATRKYGQSHDTAREYVSDWSRNFARIAAEPDHLEHALDTLARHSLSFWDALLWATVRSAGCRVLLSEDMQDGRVLGEVTILNPFAEANAPRLNALLTS
jgi:predicted nucleic acid-binding protein